MQIFWVSGAVGKIHSFNLSFKSVVLGFTLLTLLLLTTGSVLQFLGFRMALEYDPQIARQLGNLHTAVEIENLNAVYRARLADLEREQRTIMGKVKELEASNTRLNETLVPKTVVTIRQKTGAQGGVYQESWDQNRPAQGSILEAMKQLHHKMQAQTSYLSSEIFYWQAAAERLEALPLSLPVALSHTIVSSGFGERIDPVTKHKAFHAGIDFEVPPQTPVVAAGSGTVIFAGWDAQYGNSIVIRHRDGYASRYAHASELLVSEGASVFKGQQIAKSGNTGRSTGPHLHFEVLKNNQAVAPMGYLVAMASR